MGKKGRKSSAKKSASKPKQADKAKDVLDAFWQEKKKSAQQGNTSTRGPMFYLGGRRTLVTHEQLARLKWHPSETVRDERLGYGEFIRMFSIFPIHSYWHGFVSALPPSLLDVAATSSGSPAGWQDFLSQFGEGSNPELGRVLYEAIICNDDLDDDLDDRQDDKRKVIIIKAPFVLSSSCAGMPQLTLALLCTTYYVLRTTSCARSPVSCTKVKISNRSTPLRATPPAPSTIAVSTMKPARSESVGYTMSSRRTQYGGTPQNRESRPRSRSRGWTGFASSQSRLLPVVWTSPRIRDGPP